ncbi:hypothetical protein COS91_04915 [Candidatus Desantisbacteria bacterium CG07_land_8_20_14_0_80_39_15]|uniref:Excinuclease ABC subunit C n=1 Tax=Candidatus Desantisbacteria bacterium CG07_land_8_20_14_0_80_39_15 TaxID=1974549 RepID=A0A2M6ZG40_9BACT|nr:MAG: hypothetical protein COS91_04915 [Candidatus Desantisbacteria bacterium CG07_land_8_20_14_0_80_39_15]
MHRLKDLPELPGIYVFFDKTGNVIYVGKARSLKKRVKSYFTRGSYSPRLAQLREEITNFKYFITKSEVDALILECNLIKRCRPKFNIDYKDDKSYPFIQITKEKFPSISLIRIPPSVADEVVYTSDDALLFGPYPKVKIVKEAIRKIRSIFPLRNCRRKIREDKKTPLCLDYHIGLCCGPCQNKIELEEYRRFVRKVILLLRGEKKGLVNDLKRGMDRLSRELKFEEAAKLKNQLLGLEEIIGTGGGLSPSLQELQSVLNLPFLPMRIEGFDVSNIGGEFATGALVIFQNGVPCKNGYRHFSIKTVHGINDVQMLAEIVRRTCSAAARPPDPSFLLPDLILVDGGIGQLNAVSKVLEEYNFKIPVISLAKKLEEVFKKEHGKIQKLHLSLNSPVLHLLQHIRDESHRFAIKYHRILRDKEMKKSVLDEIPGIGEKRKQRLLKHFGSIEKIRESNIEELKELGIPSNIAQQILECNSGLQS